MSTHRGSMQMAADQPPSQRARRRRVMAVYGVWLVAAIVAETVAIATPVKFLAALIVVFASTLGTFGFWARPNVLTREILRSDAGLDERQTRNRLVAFRTAYRTLAVYLIVAWPASAIAISVSPGPVGYGQTGYVTAFILWMLGGFMAATLPVAWWMWQEPDPVAE